jgi:(S)-2-hydroxyglutarate dehydrogenase
MTTDIIIIGGGIVGLASAYQIQQANPKLSIKILEKESQVAEHQTGNNSGVIHSGLYYKPGSSKATNCIRGYNMLLEFCQIHNIPYQITGKVVVATKPEQVPLMYNLYERGLQNKLTGIQKISKEKVNEYEPHVSCLEGLWVPQTGIVDYRVVCQQLAKLLEQQGVQILFGQKVTSIAKAHAYSTVTTSTDQHQCQLVVNCGGLYSDKLAQMTQTQPIDVRIVPFRGEYYKIKPEKHYLVKNLIYPVPDPNFPFLGVHFTRMMRGGIEAGPNAVLAFAREGYTKANINLKELFETLAWPGFQKVALKYWQTGLGEMYRSFSKAAFTRALQELVPEIQESDLMPGGAGIRAQACDRTGGLLDDFAIIQDQNAINILNAPSPAATSSLSIGYTVAELVQKHFG